MNRLILILILTFSFQPLTKAKDIREFQIENMSIGDSLLKFMSLNEITQRYNSIKEQRNNNMENNYL